MSYQVKLEVFEGPFDLLLQLIARRRLDVTEVDLAEITADFLAHLEGLEDLDLETATRFLVVAATLIELKAARLLPAEERDEAEDLLSDARDLLYARLLEYRAFRDVSRLLAHRLTRHEGLLPREVSPEPWLRQVVPDAPLPVDAGGLAALAAAALAPRPEATVDLAHVRRSYLTIHDAASQLLTALVEREEPSIEFGALAGERERSDRVVLFLALLELFKLGHVELEQSDHRGPLRVGRRGGDDGEALRELAADASSGDEAPPRGEPMPAPETTGPAADATTGPARRVPSAPADGAERA